MMMMNDKRVILRNKNNNHIKSNPTTIQYNTSKHKRIWNLNFEMRDVILNVYLIPGSRVIPGDFIIHNTLKPKLGAS